MAFTLIDSDTSWQDLAIAEELATSYNRRRLVYGLSAVSAPTDATQVFAFIQALQNGIEEMAGYDYYGNGTRYGWLLNTSDLSTYENQTSTPASLTQAQAMTAAGLTESGYWRRIADGGSQPATWTNYSATGWSYGKVADKDLAGPWLFKDIQLALAALTRFKFKTTQGRQKNGSNSGTSSIPSTALSWGSWGSSGQDSDYSVSKRKTGGGIDLCSADIAIGENRFDMDASLDSLEADRVMLTVPIDSFPSYGSKAAKMSFSNLGVSDVSSYIGKTVTNTSTKSVSGGTLSYYAIMAEDAINIIPLANDILPDANIPDNTTVYVKLVIPAAVLIIDFTFE
jgi:hypothetical protein